MTYNSVSHYTIQRFGNHHSSTNLDYGKRQVPLARRQCSRKPFHFGGINSDFCLREEKRKGIGSIPTLPVESREADRGNKEITSVCFEDSHADRTLEITSHIFFLCERSLLTRAKGPRVSFVRKVARSSLKPLPSLRI